MKQYIGTKLVNAQPMTRIDYNDFRGWVMPEDENPLDEGYLIEQPGSPSNTERYLGYVNWSPKDVFEESFFTTGEGMNFGEALNCVKFGQKVARRGWNGKNMFIFLVPGSTFVVNRHPLLGIYPEGTEVDYHAHIDMKTADNKIVPWLASQTDVLAEDWGIID